jgi:hypothetical protein
VKLAIFKVLKSVEVF